MKIVIRTEYSEKVEEQITAFGAKGKRLTDSDLMVIELPGEKIGSSIAFPIPKIDWDTNKITYCIDASEKKYPEYVIVVCAPAGTPLRPYYIAKSPGFIQARFSAPNAIISIKMEKNGYCSIKKYWTSAQRYFVTLKSKTIFKGSINAVKPPKEYEKALQAAAMKFSSESAEYMAF